MATQVAGDLAVLAWCGYWWQRSGDVRERVLGLQGAGRRAETAGSGLQERLRSAGDAVDDLPLAGDSLASPLRSAAEAGGELADAGRSAQQAVQTVATTVFWVMVVLLVGAVLGWWLTRRLRWTRTAAVARQLRVGAEGLQVLGLRAAAQAPLGAVLRAVGGAPGRELDNHTLERLGRLELRRLGLRTF